MSDEHGLPTDEEIYQNAIKRFNEGIDVGYSESRYVYTVNGMEVVEPKSPWIDNVVEHVMNVLNHNRNEYAPGVYAKLAGWQVCRRYGCKECRDERRVLMAGL